MCFPCCFAVSTSEMVVIEQWGKFSRYGQAGLNFILWPHEQNVGTLSFRVQQLNVRVETKTLDNVFVMAVVSVQYQVLRDKCFEAFYSLTNPSQQITAHVFDVSKGIESVIRRCDNSGKDDILNLCSLCVIAF
jgi:regulator of protease activity HflC (stomatin/prohibitin superfamily)